MLNRVDFLAYHRSIAAELDVTQDRVRNLIGDAHWGEDGAHKEAVLRKTISTHLPQAYDIGTGFVTFEDGPSTQLDVIITNKDRPTLFQSGDTRIVTPDCVEAILEVKTRQSSSPQLLKTLNTLADQAERIRSAKHLFQYCWAGLFIFENPGNHQAEWSKRLLGALQESSRGILDRSINCVAFGPTVFSRFWQQSPYGGDDPDYPQWHSYVFDDPRHHGFAQTYFIGNLVMGLSSVPNDRVAYAWFPLRGQNGKEEYRAFHAALAGGEVVAF